MVRFRNRMIAILTAVTLAGSIAAPMRALADEAPAEAFDGMEGELGIAEELPLEEEVPSEEISSEEMPSEEEIPEEQGEEADDKEMPGEGIADDESAEGVPSDNASEDEKTPEEESDEADPEDALEEVITVEEDEKNVEDIEELLLNTEETNSGVTPNGLTYTYGLRWSNGVSSDVVDYHYDEDGKLIYHTMDNNIKTASLEFWFALTGDSEESIPAGAITFKVPKNIFDPREGSPYAYDDNATQIRTQIPEAPKKSDTSDFNYTVDADGNLVITNFDPIFGGMTLSAEMSYNFRPSRLYGGKLESGTYGAEDAVYGGQYFDKTISVPVTIDVDADGTPEASTEEALSVEVHTTAAPTTITKKANPDTNDGVYLSWQSSWGEKPADAGDYFYVVWRTNLKRSRTYSQPFDVKVYEDETTLAEYSGELIGAMGSQQTVNGRTQDWNCYYGITFDNACNGIAASGWEERLHFSAFHNENPTVKSWLFQNHPYVQDHTFQRDVLLLVRYPNTLIEEAEARGVNMATEGIKVRNKAYVDTLADDGDVYTRESNVAEATIIIKPMGEGSLFNKDHPTGVYYRFVEGGGSNLVLGNDTKLQATTGDNNVKYSYRLSGDIYAPGGTNDPDLGKASTPYKVVFEDGDSYLSEIGGTGRTGTYNEIQTMANLKNPVKLEEKATEFKYLYVTLAEYDASKSSYGWTEASGESKDYERIQPVEVWVRKDGGDFYHYADLKKEADGINGYDLSGNSLVKNNSYNYELTLEDGIVDISIRHKSDFYHCKMEVYIREEIKATDQVVDLMTDYSERETRTNGLFTNIAKYTIESGSKKYETDDIEITNAIGYLNQRCYRLPIVRANTTLTKSQTQKAVVDDEAHSRELREVTVAVCNFDTIHGGVPDKNIPVEEGIAFHEGVFYDLLPAGTRVDETSLYVSSSDVTNGGYLNFPKSNYTVEYVTNWNDSAQTMMIVKFTTPDDVKYLGAKYRLLRYNLINDYPNIKDRGTDVLNTAAYVNLDEDTPTNYGASNDISKIKRGSYYEELKEQYGKKIGFTEAVINYLPVKVTQTGFTKKVSTDSVPEEAIDTEAYLGENYRYRLTFTNKTTTVSDNIVIYDILDRNEGSEWQGTLDYVDTSSIADKLTLGSKTVTCAPVVYYAAKTPSKEELDIKLTDIWTTEKPSDMKQVAAIAVDCSTNKDGSSFQLDRGLLLSATVVMKAPEDEALADKTAKNIAYAAARSYGGGTPDPGSSIEVLQAEATVTLRAAKIEIHKKSIPETGTSENPKEVANKKDEPITYILTIPSLSDTQQYNKVIISDPIPEGLTIDLSKTEVTEKDKDGKVVVKAKTLVTSRADFSAKQDGQDLELEIVSLLPGHTVEFTIYTKLTDRREETTDFINTAAITKIDKHEEDIKSETTYHRVRAAVLTISKKVTGNGSKKKEFEFTVEFSDKTLNGKYGDIELTNGVGTFTLKHGQKVTISGLPGDVTYVVTEKDYTASGYKVVGKVGSEGTTVLDETLSVEYTNRKKSDPTPTPGDDPHPDPDPDPDPTPGPDPTPKPPVPTPPTPGWEHIPDPQVPLVEIQDQEVPLAEVGVATGDESHMMVYLSVMAIAAAGLAGIMTSRKMKKH